MSIYKNDLISMNFKEAGTTVAGTQTIFEEAAKFKNFEYAKTLLEIRTKEKLEIIKKLGVGTRLLVFGGKITKEVCSFKGDKVLGQLIYPGYGVLSEIDLLETVGAIIDEECYFFTNNVYNSTELKSAEQFRNYLDEMTPENIIQMIVYGVYFNSRREERIIRIRNGMSWERNGSIPKWRVKGDANMGLFAPQIGYIGKYLKISRDYQYHRKADAKEWNIDLFGKNIMAFTHDEMEAMFDGFVEKMEAGIEAGLDQLTDYELMAYYKFRGYDVRKNFLTNEWTFSENNSSKVMFVERKELLDEVTIETTWEKFSTVIIPSVSLPRISRSSMTDESDDCFYKKYGEPWQFDFYEALSELELKQFLTLEVTLGNKRFLQAMKEKDYELAIGKLSEVGNGGKSSAYLKHAFKYEDGENFYSKNWSSEPLLKMSNEQVLATFLEMENANRSLLSTKLTLPEIILKHRLEKGELISYAGIPGKFNIQKDVTTS